MRNGFHLVWGLVLLAAAAAPADAAPYRLRVMTFNAGSGTYMDLSPEGIRHIAGFIFENRVDIVGLTEIDIGTDWYGGRDHVAELRAVLAERGYDMHAYITNHVPYFNGHQVHALLSRWPIIDSENTWIAPQPGWNLDRITIEPIEGLTLDFWNCHLPVDKTGAEDLVRACFQHVAARSNPAVFMGDFNFGADGPLMDIAREAGFRHTCVDGMGSQCLSVSSAGAAIVNPMPLTGQIDHIFIRGAVETVRSYAHYYTTSDHWPVIADLAFEAPRGAPDLGENLRLPDPPRHWEEAAEHWRRQDIEKAAYDYMALLVENDSPEDGDYLNYAAGVFAELIGDASRVESILITLVNFSPETYWAAMGWQRLSYARESRQQWGRAYQAILSYLEGYYEYIHPWILSPALPWEAKRLVRLRETLGNPVETLDLYREIAESKAGSNLARAAHYQLSMEYLGKDPKQWYTHYLAADPDPDTFTNNKEFMRRIAAALADQGAFEKADYLIEKRDIGTSGGDPAYARNVRGAYWKHRYPGDYDIRLAAGKPFARPLEGDRHRFPYRDDAGDLSGLLNLSVDAGQLTIRVAVADPVHNNIFEGSELWRGDSLQVAVDPGLEGGGVYDANDSEFGVALGNDGVVRFFAWKVGDGAALDSEHVAREVVREGDRTIYTLTLPVDALGLPDPAVKRFGLTLVVNDNDGHDDGYTRAAVLEWTPGIATQKAPDMFPVITIED